MSLAKYYEDIQEAKDENWYYRGRRFETQWNSETVRVRTSLSKIIPAEDDHEVEELKKNRMIELMEIRDAISCKTNLAFSAKNSIECPSILYIIESLIHDLEDSYNRVTLSIKNLGVSEVNYTSNLSVVETKKLLVKVLIYKILNIVHNVSVIELDEVNALMDEIQKLIGWYYDDGKKYGRFSKRIPYGDTFLRFMEKEMDYELEDCPFCDMKTIKGLRYCLLCAEEL